MSNIPKSKRKPTRFQLFIDLANIRHQLTEYISHDFSIRSDKYVTMIQTLISFEQKLKSWRGSVTRRQFHNHKAVKQIDNLFFQLFNLKYEDLKKWQKQQTKTLRMISQESSV